MAARPPLDLQLGAQPMDIAFSPAGEAALLAAGLVSGEVQLHRCELDPAAPPGQPRHRAALVLARRSGRGASCRALAFASDGRQLTAGFATGTLLQLDAATGKVAVRLTKAHGAGITRLLGLPGQPSLVAAGDEAGGVRVWDMRSQAPVLSYSQHTDFITGLTAAERQHALLAVSGDGTLSAHDLRAGQALGHSETDADDELLSVAVVKGGKKVVCGSQSGVLGLWSWGYWADCSDRFPGHPESVDALLAFDEDTLLTGSSDGAVRIISILPNKLLGVVGEHAGGMPVERLSLSADLRLLASASHDDTVKLWDLAMLADESGDDGSDEAEAGEQPAAAEAGQPRGAGAAAQQLARQAAAAGAAAAGSASAGSSRRRP